MILEYLPLLSDELPVSKIFTFGTELYNFTFRKNVLHDRIYCEIRNLDDLLLYTTRLVYGNNVIHAVVDGLEINNIIVPFYIEDLFTDKILEHELTSQNLDTVKLYEIEVA